MDYINIMWAFAWFAIIGGVLGIVLAAASKLFYVKIDERVELITDELPGANCGGCGYTSCESLAQAITRGEAQANACTAGGMETSEAVSAVMGVEAKPPIRMRAQVMCSGTSNHAKQKYAYVGAYDCLSAVRMGGGDKLCPSGCIGKGSCAEKCRFDAIHVVDGVAAVDYTKCVGCGVCAEACPKHIIKLIPFDSAHWVGCMSPDRGAEIRQYCKVGCIGCRLCEKNCPTQAITVDGFIASLDHEKCIDCGKCVEVCPRKIIWSAKTQGHGLVITKNE